MLASEEAVAAVDTLGLRRRVERLEIIARFGIAVGEYRAASGLFEDPRLGFIASPPQIGRDARRQKMHVDAQCGWRRASCQAPLIPANLEERQPEPAEFFRHRSEQVLGFTQLVEIFKKEPVVPIVAGGSLRTALQEIVGQYPGDRHSLTF